MVSFLLCWSLLIQIFYFVHSSYEKAPTPRQHFKLYIRVNWPRWQRWTHCWLSLLLKNYLQLSHRSYHHLLQPSPNLSRTAESNFIQYRKKGNLSLPTSESYFRNNHFIALIHLTKFSPKFMEKLHNILNFRYGEIHNHQNFHWSFAKIKWNSCFSPVAWPKLVIISITALHLDHS